MRPGDAVILGAVQGLTEFLPVSSSGHLVLVGSLLGVSVPGVMVATSLHVGTLAAVVWFTRRELVRLFRGFRRSRESRRLAVALALGTVPAAMVGAALLPVVDSLFASTRWVALGLILTSAALWHSRRDALGSKAIPNSSDALVVGLAQAGALLPGVSRSGVTIWAALRRGMTRPQAARFSFLLSVPATAGAAAAEFVRGGQGSAAGALPLLLGGGVAAVTGWAALCALYRLVVRGRLWLFAPYCLAIGLLTGALSFV